MHRVENEGLLKFLKRSMSEHLWAVNMVKAPKHCLNLHSSISVKFFDPSERKAALKSLS